jgi:putative tryptophan/tyrosine transport system substrate-binding protein
VRRRHLAPSLPDLTRQSILLRKKMDARVKPAHDGSAVNPAAFGRRDFILALGGAAAASWPLAARAQQGGKIPTVGYLWHAGNADEETPYFGAIREGFTRLGYVEGRNLKAEHRFPNEIPERFKSMAAELVALNVDVLMGGSVASFYLRDATPTIPIVFMFVPDPVGMQLVHSIARPGGNVTGLSNFGRDIAGKRLQFLKELVPALSRVAFLVNPNQQSARMYVDVMQAAADRLALALHTFEARSVEDVEPAFDAMVRAGMQAVTPAQGGIAFQARAIIPKLALARRLPLCAFSRETFEYGALVSYGPDQLEMCYRAAVYADKILKGTKPGDLPVEQPTKFEFLLNLKTAKALGLEVPAHLQQIADEVIE